MTGVGLSLPCILRPVPFPSGLSVFSQCVVLPLSTVGVGVGVSVCRTNSDVGLEFLHDLRPFTQEPCGDIFGKTDIDSGRSWGRKRVRTETTIVKASTQVDPLAPCDLVRNM